MPTEKPSIMYVFQSRKFWAAVVGLVFIFVNAYLNKTQIDPNTVTTAIMGIIAAYMGSVALEDGMSNRNATTTTITTPSPNVDVSTSGATPPIVTHTGLQ